MRTGAAQAVPGSAPKVDLVFDVDCPNVDAARCVIRRALVATGFPPVWREWTRDAADTPPALRGLGSPTILVDGTDVSIVEGPVTDIERSNSCRIYHHGDALRGVPPVEVIARALESSSSPRGPGCDGSPVTRLVAS